MNVKAECPLGLAGCKRTRRTVFKNIYKRLSLPPCFSETCERNSFRDRLALRLGKNSSWVQTMKGEMLCPCRLPSHVINNTKPLPCGPTFSIPSAGSTQPPSEAGRGQRVAGVTSGSVPCGVTFRLRVCVARRWGVEVVMRSVLYIYCTAWLYLQRVSVLQSAA